MIELMRSKQMQQQIKKMEVAAEEAVESDYNVLDQSCIDVGSDALSAGNLDPGYDKTF